MQSCVNLWVAQFLCILSFTLTAESCDMVVYGDKENIIFQTKKVYSYAFKKIINVLKEKMKPWMSSVDWFWLFIPPCQWFAVPRRMMMLNVH